MTKPGAIIQARYGSRRLRGKVLTELVAGRTVLAQIVERCLESLAHKVVVATSKRAEDTPVAEHAEVIPGCTVFRGPHEDVLGRMVMAACAHEIDPVIRVCADCPFIDPQRIDELIWAHKDEDYLGYRQHGVPAIGTSAGLPELITRQALARLWEYTRLCSEHVTWGAYHPPPLMRCEYIDTSGYANNTLDTHDDLERMRARCRQQT